MSEEGAIKVTSKEVEKERKKKKMKLKVSPYPQLTNSRRKTCKNLQSKIYGCPKQRFYINVDKWSTEIIGFAITKQSVK